MGSKEARMGINRGEPATRKLAEAPLGTAQGRERGYNANSHGAHRSSSIPKQSTCPRFPVSGLPVQLSQRDSTTCHTALQPVHGGQAQDRRPTIWGSGSQVTTKLRSGHATASSVVHPTANSPAVSAGQGIDLRGGGARDGRGPPPSTNLDPLHCLKKQASRRRHLGTDGGKGTDVSVGQKWRGFFSPRKS